MALATATGSYPYPYGSGPSRDFYEGIVAFESVTTKSVLSTVSSSKNFVLTKLVVGVTTAKVGSTVNVIIKDTSFLTFPGDAVNVWNMDFGPGGVLFSGVDTQTAQLTIAGATCGAYAFVQGYF